jgi:pimeloyl-ACP methyl ester carboxylesterase
MKSADRRFFLCGTAAALAAPAFAPAQAAEQTPATLEPLGICLEGLPYPGPIKFLPVEMAGEKLRLAYMDFAPDSPANGRAILLLHGKNFDSTNWAGPIAFLRRAGFRVVVPDQIGFNKSSKPLAEYRFEALAGHTLALADSLGLKQFALLGHSTGGMLATRLAAMHPERVSHLLLEDPIGLVDYAKFIPRPTWDSLETAEAAYDEASYRAFVARYFPKLPPAEYEPFVRTRMRLTLSGDYLRFLRVVCLTYFMIYDGPVRDVFAHLPMPVLLMAGDRDKTTPFLSYAAPEMRAKIPPLFEAAREVAREIPHGRHVEFAGIGHVPHLEAPAEFEKAVLDFLG